MEKIKVRLTFFESVLGTAPADKELYRKFIGSNSPNLESEEEEVEAIDQQDEVEKGLTVFPRGDNGEPIFWDYQIKGFFKDACQMLSKLTGKDENGKKKTAINESSKLKAYKKIIDGLIFVSPRKIPLVFDGEISYCQRPLRAQTMKGERVALAISEEVPAGATCEFTVTCLDPSHIPAVIEWLDYGELRGIGQWRNSGRGRFTYEIIE